MHPTEKKFRHAAPNNQKQGMAALAPMMTDSTQLNRKL